MTSTQFLDNFYRQYDFRYFSFNYVIFLINFNSKPANSASYGYRPNGLGAIGRSQSQWDMYDASSSTPTPRSRNSSSFLDLARPPTSPAYQVCYIVSDLDINTSVSTGLGHGRTQISSQNVRRLFGMT